MCYPKGEFRVGRQDVLLGRIEGCSFYIGAAQYEYWAHTQLTIDVVPGRGSGFSLRRLRACAFSPDPGSLRMKNWSSWSGPAP